VLGWTAKLDVVAVVAPTVVAVTLATDVALYTYVEAIPAPHVLAAALLLESPP
jgi:hypothetical protein